MLYTHSACWLLFPLLPLSLSPVLVSVCPAVCSIAPSPPYLRTSLLGALFLLILGVLVPRLSAAPPHLPCLKVVCVHPLCILLSAVCIKGRECLLLSLLYSMLSCFREKKFYQINIIPFLQKAEQT